MLFTPLVITPDESRPINTLHISVRMAGKSKSKIGFIDRLLGRNPLITQAAGSAVRTAIGLSGESAEASESRNSGAMLKNMKEASADLDKYLQDIDKFGWSKKKHPCCLGILRDNYV